MEEFHHIFAGVEDPRKSNATRHDLHEMLMIGLLSTMCGGEGCSDMALFGHTKRAFLDSFMTLKHGIPSHDAFSDLFNALDPLKLQTVLMRLVEGFADQLGEVIAVDGKTPQRSYDRAKQQSALHLVQAFAAHSRLVLGQVAVEAKSNESTALPALLEMLSLKGRIVTADAMHTQKATARAVTQAGGDYVLALKGNQSAFFEDVSLFLDAPDRAGICDVFQRVDDGHGPIETRRALICHDLAWLDARYDWPGLKAIGKVMATREKAGKTTTQSCYYLLSTPLSAERFLAVARVHWAIENSLHWVLDVTMNEDRARNRKEKGLENLAMMRQWPSTWRGRKSQKVPCAASSKKPDGMSLSCSNSSAPHSMVKSDCPGSDISQ